MISGSTIYIDIRPCENSSSLLPLPLWHPFVSIGTGLSSFPFPFRFARTRSVGFLSAPAVGIVVVVMLMFMFATIGSLLITSATCRLRTTQIRLAVRVTVGIGRRVV